MSEIEQWTRHRRELRQKYGSLYDRLAALLFEEDPIELQAGDNTDEYEPEVDTILPRLPACRTQLEVRAVVHSELLRWFDPEEVGPVERYDRLAGRIWCELLERGTAGPGG